MGISLNSRNCNLNSIFFFFLQILTNMGISLNSRNLNPKFVLVCIYLQDPQGLTVANVNA